MSFSDRRMSPPDRTDPDGAVLAAARERVVALLTDRFADDTLTMDEFEARLDQLHAAKSASELNSMMRDLAVQPGALARPHGDRVAPRQASSDAAMRQSGQSGSEPAKRLTAVLGETTRTGPWLVPLRLEVQVIIGDVLIDLRDAVLPEGGCEIAVFCVIGRLRILVPPGVVVDDHVAPVVSTVVNDAEGGGARMLASTRVRLTGTAVISEVVVREALPGERSKDAWKRAKPVPRKK